VDTQDDDDEQKVEGGSAGSADQPLAHCAESAAAHIRPGPGKPSWLPDRLLDQGRNVAEYLAVLPSRDARVIGV
jgi:hypothetical protein